MNMLNAILKINQTNEHLFDDLSIKEREDRRKDEALTMCETMTYKEVSEKTGVPASTLSRWRNSIIKEKKKICKTDGRRLKKAGVISKYNLTKEEKLNIINLCDEVTYIEASKMTNIPTKTLAKWYKSERKERKTYRRQLSF